MWLITIASLIGVVLNIKKRKESFAIWSVTNFAWMIYDFRIGAYEQSALFGVYFVLASYGLYEWGHKCRVK